ncbi:nucleotidyltransferase domain-containing protein [Synergistaceae bacterium OttesenSCG-928-I11]|nr:nucleotidyltransferase domain-containing protein [Synergistaceae bacterium OttesenSCG-928-I11]
MCSPAMRDLKERAVDNFIERLERMENEQLMLVVLFGSVAHGNDRDDSDIDVLVVIDKEFDSPLQERHEADRIADLAFDVDVEISGRRTILSPFVATRAEYESPLRDLIFHKIDEEGIVKYASEPRRAVVSH